ncbi:MAG TPA: transaldolase family protein, partial [Candidatus Polarisedimenticolaceae bacterium]|nr:transaldolase family protein [Candidatus Polarisedimenticolaceae bacterium]
MKPENLKTKIFLDGGDAAETRTVIETLGWLDGQTTNPSLIAKNPAALERLKAGEHYTSDEIQDFYRGIVETAAKLIPGGSVSIEVTADAHTTTEEMLDQAHEMNTWIPNAHIKFPTIGSGLEAAARFTGEGGRVNMTLCFSQPQAAGVYAATKGAKRGDVFVSPFIGRFDDRGERGIDTIANIQNMYAEGDGHVMVLAASIRSMEHLLWCLSRGCDIITAPAGLLLQWHAEGKPVPPADYSYDTEELKPLP